MFVIVLVLVLVLVLVIYIVIVIVWFNPIGVGITTNFKLAGNGQVRSSSVVIPAYY